MKTKGKVNKCLKFFLKKRESEEKMGKDNKKQEEQEKVFNKIREEFKEEVQELKEKITAQNAKIRT